MNEKFVLNTNTKKLHSLEYADGRCKVNECDKVRTRYFFTPEEALAFPGIGRSGIKECRICMPRYRRAQGK